MNTYQALTHALNLVQIESKKCLHSRNFAKKQGKELDSVFYDNLFHQYVEVQVELEELLEQVSKS